MIKPLREFRPLAVNPLSVEQAGQRHDPLPVACPLPKRPTSHERRWGVSTVSRQALAQLDDDLALFPHDRRVAGVFRCHGEEF